MDPAVHTDGAGAILVDIITDKIDFNSNNYKNQIGLTLIADIQSSGSVTCSWTDNDYVTWKGSRTLDLTASRAFAKVGGVFRRRAYRFEHTTNAPFRVESFELDYQQRNT